MTDNTQYSDNGHRDLMNRVYKLTRHVYDLSRKYYLLGRDTMIKSLDIQDGETVIEVGCGTARNLIKMHKHYPNAKLMGLDASDEILKTAAGNLKRSKLSDTVMVRQAYAQNYDAKELFGLKEAPSKIVFPYCLSMIPPWKESLDHAVETLPSGGEIWIVDFYDQSDMPKWFKGFLYWWLDLFHVHFKPELVEYLHEMDKRDDLAMEFTSLYKGYSFMAKIVKG